MSKSTPTKDIVPIFEAQCIDMGKVESRRLRMTIPETDVTVEQLAEAVCSMECDYAGHVEFIKELIHERVELRSENARLRKLADAVEDIVLEAKGQEFAAHLVWCDMDGWYVSADGGLALLDECGNYEPAPDRYQVVWGDGARAGE